MNARNPSMSSTKTRSSWTLLFAAILATLGVLRLFCDFLTDIDPTWGTILGDAVHGFA